MSCGDHPEACGLSELGIIQHPCIENGVLKLYWINDNELLYNEFERISDLKLTNK